MFTIPPLYDISAGNITGMQHPSSISQSPFSRLIKKNMSLWEDYLLGWCEKHNDVNVATHFALYHDLIRLMPHLESSKLIQAQDYPVIITLPPQINYMMTSLFSSLMLTKVYMIPLVGEPSAGSIYLSDDQKKVVSLHSSQSTIVYPCVVIIQGRRYLVYVFVAKG
ncbi:MAG: hypothetical protein NZL83_00915 [Candidatus Absconditabacterales bacterium]|nr:hypothetical protein [Candidatus Absconditabacterales bacterium]